MAATQRRIGEVIVDLGYATQREVDAALEVQQQTGERLGEILVAEGKLSRLDLASSLSEYWTTSTPVERSEPPSQHLAPTDAEARDGGPTDETLTELNAVSRSLQTDATGELLLRLESEIATLGSRHATAMRDGQEALEQLRAQLDRQHTDAVGREATLTEGVQTAGASARQNEQHINELERRISHDLERVHAELAALRDDVRALVAQMPPPPTPATEDAETDALTAAPELPKPLAQPGAAVTKKAKKQKKHKRG